MTIDCITPIIEIPAASSRAPDGSGLAIPQAGPEPSSVPDGYVKPTSHLISGAVLPGRVLIETGSYTLTGGAESCSFLRRHIDDHYIKLDVEETAGAMLASKLIDRRMPTGREREVKTVDVLHRAWMETAPNDLPPAPVSPPPRALPDLAIPLSHCWSGYLAMFEVARLVKTVEARMGTEAEERAARRCREEIERVSLQWLRENDPLQANAVEAADCAWEHAA